MSFLTRDYGGAKKEIYLSEEGLSFRGAHLFFLKRFRFALLRDEMLHGEEEESSLWGYLH